MRYPSSRAITVPTSGVERVTEGLAGATGKEKREKDREEREDRESSRESSRDDIAVPPRRRQPVGFLPIRITPGRDCAARGRLARANRWWGPSRERVLRTEMKLLGAEKVRADATAGGRRRRAGVPRGSSARESIDMV